MGRTWIVQEALELAKAEGLPIENAWWGFYGKDDPGLPEQRLCFDLNGKRHSVLFSDDEIDDCTPPAYASIRSLVARRLKETFRRLKRETYFDST